MIFSTTAMVALVHNPSLGAICIWQFACGYCQNGQHSAVPLDVLYYVYPVLVNGRLREEIIHTTKNLWKVREKLRNSEGISVLLKMPELVDQMRTLSSDSIALAFSTGLLSFDWDLQGVVLKRKTVPPIFSNRLSDIEQEYIKASRRLGHFGAEMTHGAFQFALGVK